MTQILHFSIEGLAGRKGTVEHRLNPDVNVFWGSNGSGKTSMLKILHSALNDEAEIVDRVAFKSATVTFWSENHNCEYTRRLDNDSNASLTEEYEETWSDELDQIVLVPQIKETKSWDTHPRTQREVSRFRHGWLPISRISGTGLRRSSEISSMRRGPMAGVTEGDIDQIFARGIQDRWRQWYGESSRAIREAQDEGLKEVLEVALRGEKQRDSSVKLLPPKEAYRIVGSFFGGRRHGFKFKNYEEFRGRYQQDTILPDIVRRLQKVEEKIMAAVAPQVRLEQLIADLFARGREVQFSPDGITVTMENRQIPLGLLSSGERQLLLLLLECLRGESSSILVDEPELSLHVDWQQKLVKSMQTVNPNAQLVMATHSPEVMADLEDRCVIEL